MILLHRIGPRINSNFNTLEEIIKANPREALSFDGVYEEVYKNYKALKGREVVFFFSGKYLGGDNKFDAGQPYGKFCTLEQIYEMRDYLDAKLGYHGWAHLDCTGLSDEEVRAEITPPEPFKRMDYLAWPYGSCDARCAKIAEDLGYKSAWSVRQGDGSEYQLPRRYLNW